MATHRHQDITILGLNRTYKLRLSIDFEFDLETATELGMGLRTILKQELQHAVVRIVDGERAPEAHTCGDHCGTKEAP